MRKEVNVSVVITTITNNMRTHTNGELRIEHVGQEVLLYGWVAKRRNFGQLVFIDLRDRKGITQLVFGEEISSKISDVRNEYVLEVRGSVVERKDKNPKMPTGDIEIKVSDVKVLSSAKTPPIIVSDETDALEDTRLLYRYIDLRRPVMQNKLVERHNIVKSLRNYLDALDFVEVETPMLAKSTPEGARDYLVPSRVHPGSFYALPQSPQLFKQLLMIGGMDRYYQFARCFRDEDLRADRQTDFTQVDIEMSFMSEDEILTMSEDMMSKMMKEVKGLDVPTPFIRIPYDEAMNRFGSDKPDNRFGIELQDITSVFEKSEFKVFQGCIENGGVIKAIVVPNKADMTRKEIDTTTELAKKYGAKGLVTCKYIDGELSGSANKFFSEDEVNKLIETLELTNNDIVFIVSDDWTTTCEALGALRNNFGDMLGLRPLDTFSFLWVTDFPLLEYDPEDGRYYAKHHPFTRPKEEDIPLLDSDPSKVKASAYDMVLNGYELGGGSLRIYDPELQSKIFSVLGFSDEQIEARFGFFIDAFNYGTPPHGGLAFGLDRIAMILTGSTSLRDVIAFPKNANAKDMMSDAPSEVDIAQLDELHIAIKE